MPQRLGQSSAHQRLVEDQALKAILVFDGERAEVLVEILFANAVVQQVAPCTHQSFFCPCFAFPRFYCCTKSLLEIMNVNGIVTNSKAAQQEVSSWADELALLQHQGFLWKDQGSVWWGSV